MPLGRDAFSLGRHFFPIRSANDFDLDSNDSGTGNVAGNDGDLLVSRRHLFNFCRNKWAFCNTYSSVWLRMKFKKKMANSSSVHFGPVVG